VKGVDDFLQRLVVWHSLGVQVGRRVWEVHLFRSAWSLYTSHVNFANHRISLFAAYVVACLRWQMQPSNTPWCYLGRMGTKEGLCQKR
jgi:hypothetical protein